MSYNLEDIYNEPQTNILFLSEDVKIEPIKVDISIPGPHDLQSPEEKKELSKRFPRIVQGIEIISEVQEQIVFSNDKVMTAIGCYGSRKTDTLCKYGFKQFREGKNVLFL